MQFSHTQAHKDGGLSHKPNWTFFTLVCEIQTGSPSPLEDFVLECQ